MTTFVQPDPPPAPRTDIVRRQDIIDQFGRIVDVYQEQQQTMLGTVQQAAQSGSFSTAEQVRERRYTSGMYLTFYGIVVAMAMLGLTLIAWQRDMVDGFASFAFWLVGTGIVALTLAWIRHGQEMQQTPESVARHIVDWHGSVAEYDAETRRLSLQWEHEAEERRAQAAAADNAHARQMAQLRIAEMESRQRMQADRTTLDTPVAPPSDIAAIPAPAAQDAPAPRPSPLKRRGRPFCWRFSPHCTIGTRRAGSTSPSGASSRPKCHGPPGRRCRPPTSSACWRSSATGPPLSSRATEAAGGCGWNCFRLPRALSTYCRIAVADCRDNCAGTVPPHRRGHCRRDCQTVQSSSTINTAPVAVTGAEARQEIAWQAKPENRNGSSAIGSTWSPINSGSTSSPWPAGA